MNFSKIKELENLNNEEIKKLRDKKITREFADELGLKKLKISLIKDMKIPKTGKSRGNRKIFFVGKNQNFNLSTRKNKDFFFNKQKIKKNNKKTHKNQIEAIENNNNTIDDLNQNNFIIFKNYKIFLQENANYDWGAYSKNYGHPKKTVEDRFLVFRKIKTEYINFDNNFEYARNLGIFGGEETRKNLNSFRKSEINKMFFDFFKIKELKNQDRKMVLDFHYRHKFLRKKMGISIYSRMLKGVHQDYIFKKGKYIYHNKKEKEGILNILKKIKNEFSEKNKIISFQICKNLGFCEIGINDFCDILEISKDEVFKTEELKKIFDKSFFKKDLIEKYKKELVTINLI